ncbi:HET-domain-containing protein [Eremomyces bilateralis CBS 781.70]|uniref:HET-domain-containing protein n=1 Tax=Eremomyces bilateralis CBS 781.70 TaxID=1392243 RepID=A0A6G1FZB9_9PEZI|nr:HET-domain-containing protein [Eremomyces bilateralis CBS 781.70]KAF1811197.1 HET-domain-containing protein [Eremomyces bilateralis CBS 781.70]
MLRIGIGLALATGAYFSERNRRHRGRARAGSEPPARRRRPRREAPYSDEEFKSGAEEEDWKAVQPWRKSRRAVPRHGSSPHGSSDFEVVSAEQSDRESLAASVSAATHCPSYDLIVAGDSFRPSSRSSSGVMENQMVVPYTEPRAHAPANIPRYVYRPLRGNHTIRLIELHPAMRLSDTLAFRFFHVDLDMLSIRPNGISYEALSYVWGSHIMHHSTYCYDSVRHQIPSGQYPPVPSYCYKPITASVDGALRRLRYSDRSRILWVDQLCIDQESFAEKNHQVRQMSNIYSRAGRVLVWLGEDKRQGERALSLIKRMGKWMLKECDPSGHLPSTETAQTVLDERLTTVFGHPDLGHVQQFFLRKYFRRRWVIQELVCAQRAVVVCGTKECDWEYFAAAIQLFHQLHVRDTLFDGAVLSTVESLRYIDFLKRTPSMTEELGILDFLSLFHAAECGDDNDRIIALLGISDGESASEGLDYGLSTEELYSRFASQSIDDFGLDILHLAGTFKSNQARNGGLKSWMPDWRAVPLHKSFVSIHKFSAGIPMDADSRRSELMWVTEHGELLVEGFVLDTVFVTSDSVSRPLGINEIINILPDWAKVAGLGIGSSPDASSQLKSIPSAKALATTLIADHGHYEGTGFHLTHGDRAVLTRRKHKLRISAWKGFRELFGSHTTDHRHRPARSDPNDSSDSDTPHPTRTVPRFSKHARQYAQLVGTTMSGRCLFRTCGGRVGIGPEGMQSGDFVVILLGARTPFVLRPGSRSERFTLVGDTYVHHCMDGRMAAGRERQFLIE